MNLTAVAFHECALAALDELESQTTPTEIRRVDHWLKRFAQSLNTVKNDFSGDALGEREPEAEDISYDDVHEDPNWDREAFVVIKFGVE